MQNRKSEHIHRIQHIQISMDSQFHFKKAILITFSKFAQKEKKKIAYLKTAFQSFLVATKFAY